MATCLTSINNIGDQLIELSSNVIYASTINQTQNTIYLLSNELDQSVFFNIRVLGTTSNISFTLTIYNETTLAQFGSLAVTQNSVSTSFNIKAGRYYVCIRSQVLSYNVELIPTFISYNRTTIFQPKCYMGATSITNEIKMSKPVGICTRRLLYTIIEGALPRGLTMLDNGYISGYLPILDTDEYNSELPTSNTWYHKVCDDEYITNWGRAYRFKVHLTLFDDRTKEDIRWFYITIVNDYSKNLALIDKYEELDDNRDVTFEEKIKLATLSLCPPCDIYTDTTYNTTDNKSNINDGKIILPDYYDKNSSINVNNQTLEQLSNENTIDMSKDNIIDIINSSNNNNKELYDLVENNLITDEDNVLIYNYDFNNIDDEGKVKYKELIVIPNDNNNNITFNGDIPLFSNIRSSDITINAIKGITNKGLVEYYITNFDSGDLFIEQLKDSSMYQSYLKENNINNKYIIEYPIERMLYEDIELAYITVKDEITKSETHYIQFTNNASIADKDDQTNDAAGKFKKLYDDSYAKLPLMVFNIYGWNSEVRLVVPGK